MKDFLQQYGIELGSLVAGLAGGIVSLTRETKLSVRRSLVLILTGGFMAGYTTPMIAHYADISMQLQNGLSFIIGLTSMRLVEFFIKYVDSKTANKIEDSK